MTVTVTALKDVKGKWVNNHVQVLEEPRFDDKLQCWTALAIAYGMLAIVSLQVTPLPLAASNTFSVAVKEP
jgi:hypothetical protein